MIFSSLCFVYNSGGFELRTTDNNLAFGYKNSRLSKIK